MEGKRRRCIGQRADIGDDVIDDRIVDQRSRHRRHLPSIHIIFMDTAPAKLIISQLPFEIPRILAGELRRVHRYDLDGMQIDVYKVLM